MRDVRTDAERGRIYLPQSELKKFNVSEEDILNFKYSDRFHALAANVADRAKNFYRLARQTLPAEDRRAMVAAELMGAVYWQLLQKLERHQFNVFGPQSMRLAKPAKTGADLPVVAALRFGFNLVQLWTSLKFRGVSLSTRTISASRIPSTKPSSARIVKAF